MCNAQICPTTTNICQIRLDFDTFVITGPSTVTVSVGLFLGGEGNAGGVAQMDRGQCKSDTFAISNAPHIPVVCGTLTGEHSKFHFHHILDFCLSKYHNPCNRFYSEIIFTFL